MKPAFLAAAALMTVAAVSPAAILVSTSPQLDNQYTFANVLFSVDNPAAGSDIVLGVTNTTPGVNVEFSSTGLLTTPSNGQARIEGVQGGNFTDLLITPGMPVYAIQLNINTQRTDAVDPRITFSVGGNTVGNILVGRGENRVTIYGTDGETISSLLLTASVDSLIEDVRQIRLAVPAEPSVEAIPEPGTMALMGGGLLFAGLAFRRRKQ